MQPLFHKKEWIFLSCLILLLIAFLFVRSFRSSSSVAVVTYHGEQLQEIDLSKDGVYTIQGELTATLEVKNHRIRFIHSQCPDKVCEAFGWISHSGESAICMPAKLAVQIP